MANRDYELLFVISPALNEEERETLLNRVRGYLTEGQGEILRFEPWGLRRLAYPIRKQREGYYYLVHFSMDAANVKPFERNLLLAEGVLRELILRLDEVQTPGQTPVPPPPAFNRDDDDDDRYDDEDDD